MAAASLTLLAGPAMAARTKPVIAMTVDDLPVHGPLPAGTDRVQVAKDVVRAFRQARLPPVYGFINGTWSEDEPASMAVLDVWQVAGNPLGNHTWAHGSLDQMSAADYLAAVDRNEPLLKARMGSADWRWFRYPFLAEGFDPAKRDTVRAGLARRGYRIAQVTMSFGDYAWNEPYARCAAQGDAGAIRRLEASYLAAAHDAARDARAIARSLYGRDIPYVLLMHIGAFDARMMPRLIAQYRADGFGFVSLPVAEADPAYAADVDPSRPALASVAERLQARGAAMPPPRNDQAILDAICRPPVKEAP